MYQAKGHRPSLLDLLLYLGHHIIHAFSSKPPKKKKKKQRKAKQKNSFPGFVKSSPIKNPIALKINQFLLTNKEKPVHFLSQKKKKKQEKDKKI